MIVTNDILLIDQCMSQWVLVLKQCVSPQGFLDIERIKNFKYPEHLPIKPEDRTESFRVIIEGEELVTFQDKDSPEDDYGYFIEVGDVFLRVSGHYAVCKHTATVIYID